MGGHLLARTPNAFIFLLIPIPSTGIAPCNTGQRVLNFGVTPRCSARACQTGKVRVAENEGTENEGRARAAAEAQAGEMLKELTNTRAQLQHAHSQVFELQGCARALEGAGEDAALARQLVVEKEAECTRRLLKNATPRS